MIIKCPLCNSNLEFKFQFEGIDILFAHWFYRCPKCKTAILLKIAFNKEKRTYELLAVEHCDTSYIG